MNYFRSLTSFHHFSKRRVTRCSIWLCLSLAPPLLARDIQVTSVEQLQAALANAAPDDKVVVADGEYDNRTPLKITKAGTKLHPIEITAATVGGVEIKGSEGFSFAESAAHIILRGFRFTHQAGTITLPKGTHHCQITRNLFELKVAGRATYLSVFGDDNEIDHNTFQNKKTEGRMLEVFGPAGTAMAQRTWIHHNYFNNFEETGRNDSEALHIGSSSRSMSPANSLVEYNLFVKTRGEQEGAICNKSGENTYRFNTFGEGCTELSLRHGNHCLVYGNFFVRTRGGLRFFGNDHRIFCNYFERNRTALQIGNGDGNIPPAELIAHDRPDDVQVAFNTFVDNRFNAVMRRRRDGLGATRLVVAYNVFQAGNRAVSIGGPLVDPTWTGNFVWQTSPGDIPAEGSMLRDPQLEKSQDGTYRLKASSPAIRMAAKAFTDFGFAAEVHKQVSQSDVDAAPSPYMTQTQRILTPTDVGPLAK